MFHVEQRPSNSEHVPRGTLKSKRAERGGGGIGQPLPLEGARAPLNQREECPFP